MSFFGSSKADEEQIRKAAGSYNNAANLPNSKSTTSITQLSSYETASEHESIMAGKPDNNNNNTINNGATLTRGDDDHSNVTITEAQKANKDEESVAATKDPINSGSSKGTATGSLEDEDDHSAQEYVAAAPAHVPAADDANDNSDDDENPRLNDFDSALHRSLSRASRTRSLEKRRSLLKEGLEDSEEDAIPLDKLNWDSPTDPENPQNWPSWKKWYITMTTAFVALVVTFGSSLYTCGVEDLVARGKASQTLTLAGLTFYVLGLAFGPVIAAPLSELFGRRVVYWASFPLSLIFTLGVGFSNKIREILVLRFFAGLIGSPALAVCSGTISDMWALDQIEVAMSFFCLAPFAGPVVGPVIGGYAVEKESWRWTMWIILFFGALLMPFLLICPETYKPVLLKRRAKKRGIKVAKPDVSAWEFMKMILQLFITKPIMMLIVEPIVLVFSIWSAFIFAVLFGFFEAYPIIFQGVYHFTLGNSGLPFLGIGFGLVLGTIFYLWLVKKVFWKKNPDGSSPLYKNGVFTPPKPESRLLPAKVGAIFLPIGLFWVGWSGRKESVHWIVAIIGGVPFGFGLILIFFSTITYFSLSYPPISVASAIAANNFMRYILASVFPLFTVQMYNNVGIGWASSIFAFISLAMIPIPWIFEKWGPKLRETSRFSYGAVMKQKKLEEEKAKAEQGGNLADEKADEASPAIPTNSNVGGEAAIQKV